MRSASPLAVTHVQRASTGRVLIVSNRLPITARVEDGEIHVTPSSGGVATGLRRVNERWQSLWIGWSGLANGVADPHRIATLAADAGSIAIPLSDAEIVGFYRQYSNSLLWPVLHGWTDHLAPTAEDWHAYRRVNDRYAAAVAEQLRSTDRVWIHDYHLLLAPKLVRERRQDARIGFFLHTPFPDYREIATVPQFAELLEGMLGADVIGFHTADYAQRFLEAVSKLLGHRVRRDEILIGKRCVRVCVEPMGIDAAAFERLATQPDVLAEVKTIKRAFAGHLMLGVDRLDYTKGILQRLLAFQRLLEIQPQLLGRITLIQIAVPTREDVRAYQDLRHHVEKLVARINSKFGGSGWIPIEYFFGTVDLNTLVALYRAADVMLVTPIRDGMNLVAKEFVASRPDGDGVLILSQHAGAASELHTALLANPTHVEELVRVYRVALTMSPAERQVRMRHLRKAVAGNDVFQWSRRFMERLAFESFAQADPAIRAE
jgi:trehalose 6-phosphate synthase/phosphatase